MKQIQIQLIIAIFSCGCSMSTPPISQSVPAKEYADGLRAELGIPYRETVVGEQGFSRSDSRAQLSYVKDMPPHLLPAPASSGAVVSNMSGQTVTEPGYLAIPSAHRETRPYRPALAPGNPGVEASLYREHRAHNSLFRDHRAFQPMDLITIRITENVDATTEADTEVTRESTFLAGIAKLFNIESTIERKNRGFETSELIDASSTSEFTGEGDTSRKGQFTAAMSAMVVEVLPSGILRVEGKRIVTVNNEEQTLLVTGLVRPRDINSQNEINSNKIANLRVDLYGHGSVGSAQTGGWLGNTLREYWPF